MPTPDPASLLSHQAAIFGDIERVLNHPIPDFRSGLPKFDIGKVRDWLTGPFLTLARQFVTPPPSDNPKKDHASRRAALLFRLAHQVVCCEQSQLDEFDECSEGLDIVTGDLEREIKRHLWATRADREALIRALQKVAHSLLPRTHEELFERVVNHTAPSMTRTGSKVKRAGKGKHIEARMLKIISKNRESWSWTAARWAKELNCSDGTIKATDVWKNSLKQLRQMSACEAASCMDRTQCHSTGRQKRAHRPE